MKTATIPSIASGDEGLRQMLHIEVEGKTSIRREFVKEAWSWVAGDSGYVPVMKDDRIGDFLQHRESHRRAVEGWELNPAEALS